MRVTICFGGSIFGDPPDPDVLNEMAKSLRKLKENKHTPLVVTGGGDISRKYIKAIRELGLPDNILDEIGIKVTRLNARILTAALKSSAHPEPIKTFEEAVETSFRGKIPVMGGTTPGHTTDAVAAKLADSSRSDLLVFFSDVDGVYTADPNKSDAAKKIDFMSISELIELASKKKFEPGMRSVIDPFAGGIIRRAGIKTLVLGKKEIKRLNQIIEGADHSGTVIRQD